MKGKEIKTAIEFLIEKKILSSDKTQWVVVFQDMSSMDIVKLMEEYKNSVLIREEGAEPDEKDALIAKQQIQLQRYQTEIEENIEVLKDIHGMFYSIGRPLNDNVLQFNKDQLKWCMQISELFESLHN